MKITTKLISLSMTLTFCLLLNTVLYAQEINPSGLLSHGTPDTSSSTVWDAVVDTVKLGFGEAEEVALLAGSDSFFSAYMTNAPFTSDYDLTDAGIPRWFLVRYLGKAGKDGCTCGSSYKLSDECPASFKRRVYISNKARNDVPKDIAPTPRVINDRVVQLIQISKTYKDANQEPNDYRNQKENEDTKEKIVRCYEDYHKSSTPIPKTFGTRQWEFNDGPLRWTFHGMYGGKKGVKIAISENGTEEEPYAKFKITDKSEIKGTTGNILGHKYRGTITYHQKDWWDNLQVEFLGIDELARAGYAANYWTFVEIDEDFEFTVPRGAIMEKVLDQYQQLRKKATMAFLQSGANINSVKPVFDEIGKLKLNDCPKEFQDAFMEYSESVRLRILGTSNLTNMSSTQSLQKLGANSRNVEENVKKIQKICEKYDVTLPDLD
ncbi:MAG: hypothetical protein LBJ67_08835 [Planctomycetaceae bacterium]|jgi:hypothetical protein|nr:hypothetical protein [Planctomycetaceae bacterium]